MGEISWLYYPSVIALLRLYRVKNMQAVFEDLQIMEMAALNVIRKAGS